MKKLNFFRFCMFMAVALFAGAGMTSCSDDEDPVGPVPTDKAPTITLTAGVATESTLTFTIATTDAAVLAYTVIDTTNAGAIDDSAESIIEYGTALEAKASQEVTADNLNAETKYLILAAVANEAGKTVSQTLEMTTLPAESAEPNLFLSENTVEATADGTTKVIVIYVENSTEVPTVSSDNATVFMPQIMGEAFADPAYPDAVAYNLHIDVAANKVEKELTGTVTVALGSLTETISCRQDAYVAPLQQEGAVTITFASYFGSEQVMFDAAGSVYEWDGFKFTFINNSGDFAWKYGLSGFINMENGDTVKIDGMGVRTITKVEWISTDENMLHSGMYAGETVLTPSEVYEDSTQYYFLTWEGAAADAVEFTTNFGDTFGEGASVYPSMVRITYAE